jgi:ParB family transcriptional regulator, chromosome partitioning protein
MPVCSKVMPVIITSSQKAARQVLAMLIENLGRSDLSPIEEGGAYQTILELGDADLKSQKAIAAALGFTPQRVSSRLKLTKLPGEVQGRVHVGQLRVDDALSLGEFVDEPHVGRRRR